MTNISFLRLLLLTNVILFRLPCLFATSSSEQTCSLTGDNGTCGNANNKNKTDIDQASVSQEQEYSPDELARGLDLGVSQKIGGSLKDEKAMAITKAREYMSSPDVVDSLDEELKALCVNENEECAFWAVTGECDANPTFMKKSCAPMCHSCDYLSYEGRCPMDPDAPDAWEPGDLDKMFLKLTSEPYLSEYNVQVYSSPFDEEGGPWLITLDNVVKEEEAKRLIELGAIEGYIRSTNVGELKADGSQEALVDNTRTSMNAWCSGPCYEDKMAQRVIHRLSDITGIDETNSEHLQLLQYEEGQYYTNHHDYIDIDVDRQPGVRILTFYLYLNDVEEGGGTNFDKVKNTTVMPKRGRAVLWPSVLNDDPSKEDPRTSHEALPVIKGVKYGANAWFHLRDFKTPHSNGCS